jgi:hypothetical protein
MFSRLLGFVSGLAYLTLCLLIAASRARKKCLREEASTIGQSAGENDRSVLWSLSASGLISLSSFLFMPCGTLPSLLSVSGGALAVIGTLALAPVFRDGWARSRGWRLPLCLAVSLAAIAHCARQRGLPGELYALDAYVSMPFMSVTDAWGKSGLCLLAAASLFALYGALPAQQRSTRGESLLATLVAEVWMLAAIGFWVCLFFPHSLAYGRIPEISVLGKLALDALVFWGKVLGLAWLLGGAREKWPHDLPFHTATLCALSGIGVWLLLLDTPVA